MKLKDQIIAILLTALGVILLLSLMSYEPADLAQYEYPPSEVKHNLLKLPGAYLADFFIRKFGYTALLFPFLLFYWALLVSRGLFSNPSLKIIGLLFSLFSLASLIAVFSINTSLAYWCSGIYGLYFAQLLINYFGRIGSAVIFFTVLLMATIIATELPIHIYILNTLWKILKVMRGLLLRIFKYKKPAVSNKIRTLAQSKAREKISEEVPKTSTLKIKEEFVETKKKPSEVKVKIKKEKKELLPSMPGNGYQLPPLELLNPLPPLKERKIIQDLSKNAQLLEDTLRDFGIEAKVVNIEKGPVITRYELQPASGIKVQWIASLADDIALVMKSYNVNVIAPLPGKGTVGVDVPNVNISYVYLREVIESPEFEKHQSLLALALGKTVAGEPLIADLTNMPHLLIAGTTGSGKTVCINSLLTSLLYRATPDEVKFILIDPKMVELAHFNGLPHLIVPVVTDANQAVASLEWAVAEMESRYQLLAKAGVRNILSYNEKKKEPQLPKHLPYIVIIIDELADLMLTASKEIESAIARLAQLSRAIGIHMILATQRPSVDVITGVIKANFPSRISFKVASKVDSRTVLDINGADKLLGKGDMLFIPPGSSKPIRAQGCLIKDEEIERVVNFIKSQRKPKYQEEIFKSTSIHPSAKSKRDRLYEEAVDVIMETGQASVSILQRRLGIGYTRAARLIDLMEEDGIVGPYRGAKPREILIDRETYLREKGLKEGEENYEQDWRGTEEAEK